MMLENMGILEKTARVFCEIHKHENAGMMAAICKDGRIGYILTGGVPIEPQAIADMIRECQADINARESVPEKN